MAALFGVVEKCKCSQSKPLPSSANESFPLIIHSESPLAITVPRKRVFTRLRDSQSSTRGKSHNAAAILKLTFLSLCSRIPRSSPIPRLLSRSVARGRLERLVLPRGRRCDLSTTASPSSAAAAATASVGEGHRRGQLLLLLLLLQ